MLGACGEEAEPTNDSAVEEAAVEETTEENTSEEIPAEETLVEKASNELNQVIADDENVKATLISVTKATDSSGETIYEALFEVENKLDEEIYLGHTKVLGDGQADSLGQSSIRTSKIAPGTTGKATIIFYGNEAKEFPKKIDLDLTVGKINPEDPKTGIGIKQYPVSFTLPVDESSEATSDNSTAEGINFLIVDNESVKVSLIDVMEVEDPHKGKVFEVTFEIENRLTDNVVTPGHYDVAVNGQEPLANRAGFTDSNIEPQSTGQGKLRIYADQEPTISELNSLKLMLTISKRIEGETMLQNVGDFPVDVTF